MRNKLFVVVLSVCTVVAFTGLALACTSFIAGKKTTADGSVMSVHNEDLNATTAQRVEVFPAKKFKKGQIEYLTSGEPLPWVAEKYKVIQFNSGFDPTDYNADNPNLINEFGVTSWDNAMTPRTELRTIEDKNVQKVDSKELKRIPLERAQTAREAVKILGDLVDTYGFMQAGMAYGIADPKEGWIVEVTKGKHWVAHRVPDDMIVFRSNCYRIQKVDLSDSKNFLGSKNLVKFAVKQGWWPDGAADFNFSQAYGSLSSMSAPSNTLREWGVLNFLKPGEVSAERADSFYPYVRGSLGTIAGLGDAVYPAKRLTVEDAMAFCRIHYEGSIHDASNGYKVGSPHWTANRVICVDTTNSSTIFQLRKWMPLEIGCVMWRTDSTPCTSVYVPWYLGITTTPVEFRTGTSTPSGDSAWWTYRTLTLMIDAHYEKMIGFAQSVFSPIEKDLLDSQGAVEATALEMYERNPKKAANYLTKYCGDAALNALDAAKGVLTNVIKESADNSWKNTVCPAP